MIKSVFERFVSDPRVENSGESELPASEKILTPANLMTASRPILAAEASRRLLSGQKGAFAFAALAAATDAEGNVARWIDKVRPEWGRGVTIHGAEWDPRADTAAALMMAFAALKGPRVSVPGKLAVATVLGQEGYKTLWALRSDRQYRDLADTTEHLWLQPSKDGKLAMAEKLSALCLAIGTNDTDDFRLRTGLGFSAMAFAGIGAIRGEFARYEYVDELNHLFEDLGSEPSENPSHFVNWEDARLNNL
ncbi:hypothetical protein KDA00_05140 [Candidatus Saccharibacteria bacterium]|nr:hypothetical protein [Candidatus Saccharibacteria bacterium]